VRRAALLLLAACSGGTPSEPPPDSGTPDAGLPMLSQADQQAMLDATNAVRANAMPAPSPALLPLTWSDAAAQHAQAWASGCTFTHSNDSSYGENIFAATTSTSPGGVVASWEAEKSDYDYATNQCSSICGHYTQLVWRSTTSVGCGVATCTSGSPFSVGGGTWQFWVCNYDPAGNFVGQKPY
jgi:uncharacterized protein YkwD